MLDLRGASKITPDAAIAMIKLDILEAIRRIEERVQVPFAEIINDLSGPPLKCAVTIGPVFGDLAEMSDFAQSNSAASAAIKVTNKIEILPSCV